LQIRAIWFLVGYGAIYIPSKIEIGDSKVAKKFKIKIWTMDYYVIVTNYSISTLTKR
jgi:hypothetical protein